MALALSGWIRNAGLGTVALAEMADTLSTAVNTKTEVRIRLSTQHPSHTFGDLSITDSRPPWMV